MNRQQLDRTIAVLVGAEFTPAVLTAPYEQLVRVHTMSPGHHRYGHTRFERLQYDPDLLLHRPPAPTADRSTAPYTHPRLDICVHFLIPSRHFVRAHLKISGQMLTLKIAIIHGPCPHAHDRLLDYGKAGGPSPAAAVAPCCRGVPLCAGCGCRLVVAYSGHYSSPIYRCERPNQMLGRPRYLTLGAKRVDTAIAGELLLAIQPITVEAALHAEHMYM